MNWFKFDTTRESEDGRYYIIKDTSSRIFVYDTFTSTYNDNYKLYSLCFVELPILTKIDYNYELENQYVDERN